MRPSEVVAADGGLRVVSQQPTALRPLKRRWLLVGGALAVWVLLGLGPAWAAQPGNPATSEAAAALFLFELSMLMLFGRLLGEVAQRFGQPSVIGQLAAGVLLGPSVFGLLWPTAHAMLFPENPELKGMLQAVSQLGVMLLLLITGMEVDLKLVKKVRLAATSASLGGIVVPFALGFALGQALPAALLPDPAMRLVTSLFMGTALAISSVKVVAMVVKEMDFTRRNLGQVMIAAAIIDDTLAWIIIAIIFAIAENGAAHKGAMLLQVGEVATFMFVSLRWGGRVVAAFIRFVNDNFISDIPVITAILLVTFGFALVTDAIGAHAVLGAFVAGILIGRSPILTGHIEAQLRGLIVALFMPVFFGLAGMGVNLTLLSTPAAWGLLALLVAVASLGKFAGAGLGGLFGGLSGREALALGMGMNARGSTEVIVATLALSLGAFSPELFTLVVAMAIITTTVMPPSLRWALARVPIGAEEEARLAREASEAEGFIATLERFLVAGDESPSGQLASRMAGLLAGARGKPVTVLALTNDDAPVAHAEHAAVIANESARRMLGDEADSEKPLPADVTIRKPKDPPAEAVGTEAAKGYDLLLIGRAYAADAQGVIAPATSQLAEGFDGCLALLLARGTLAADANGAKLNILVPITGNPASRRAAETAIILAEVAGATVTGIYVADELPATSSGYRSNGLARDERAVLSEFLAMAKSRGVRANTKMRRTSSVTDTILTEADNGKYSLLLVGVSRRVGENLFFGNRAKALVQSCTISIMLLSS